MVTGWNSTGMRRQGWHRPVLAGWRAAKKVVSRWLDFGYRLEPGWHVADRRGLHRTGQRVGCARLPASFNSTRWRRSRYRLGAEGAVVRGDHGTGRQPVASLRRTVGSFALATPGSAPQLRRSIWIRSG